ncbi:glycosyltransferase family 4 protein [Marinomonas colpomeniae]|uniref:Glycosyltransferase family 4 protein n=1 Tax=Marinomonas colpomeniae TaxID=2774408 RepID=A0ABR8NW19_9GAMM|nr:glycosyltransferase family 4 protein [Marinomonas colpomeniae]MBD5769795.1 glycosyltransferase family 4 protein [Marinomonas colpomeniae]
MSNSLNILHVCLSPGYGGLEMYPIRTGKAMVFNGYNVYGLAQLGTPTHDSMLNEFTDTFSLQSRSSGYLKLFTLAKWIRKYNISHVHCHKSSDLILAVLLKKLCDFKLIYTDHMGVKRPKKDFYHNFIYRNVDLLLSISHFTRSFNVKALPIDPDKNKTLWLGTKIPETHSTDLNLRQELSLSNEIKLVGIIGRVSHGKGHEELLAAFKKMECTETHLLIVGGLTAQAGGDEGYVQGLKSYVADNDLQDRVTFYGFSDETKRLLSAIDVVVIPSHLEAFGLTVIEAMAVGKAIIGSSHGAIPEILEDSGILVDPFDVSAFSKVIDALCSNSQERERLSRISKRRAQEYFDQDKHIQSLLALYQECG